MQDVFMNFKKACHQRGLRSALVKNKMKKRNLIRKVQVLVGMKEYVKYSRKVERAFGMTRRKVLKKKMGKVLRVWYGQFKRVQDLQDQEQVADQAYRSRYLTTYLAKWLQKLHKKLKNRHLKENKEQFQKFRVRRRFL